VKGIDRRAVRGYRAPIPSSLARRPLQRMPNLASFDLTTHQNQQVLQNLATYLPPAAWVRHIQANHDTVLSGSGNALQPATLAMQHQPRSPPCRRGT
jgi:Tfp pilus assembly protein PilN